MPEIDPFFIFKNQKNFKILRDYNTLEINEDIFRYIRPNNNQCHGYTS